MKHRMNVLAFLLAALIPAGAVNADTSAATDTGSSKTEVPLAPLDDELAHTIGQEGYFSLRPGQTLREAFTSWSNSAGYTLIWLAPIDLPIEAAVTFPPGTRYTDAVRQTLGAFWRSKHAVTGKLYKNRVLVVSGRDA